MKKMVVMCCGNCSVVVPCVVANKVNHLVKKYHLKVGDGNLLGGWDEEDFTTIEVYCDPTNVLNTRRFKNEIARVNKKFIKNYGWEIDFDIDIIL